MHYHYSRRFLFSSRSARIYLHALFILLIITCEPVFKSLYAKNFHFSWPDYYGLVALIFYTFTLSCIYFTAFVILRNRPRLNKGAALLIQVTGMAGMFLLFIPLRFLIEQKLEFLLLGISNYPQNVDIGSYIHENLFFSFMILVAGAYLKFMDDWYVNDRIKSDLEKQNLRLELDFLKSQVNPHFLFNTLNNIQSYIVQDEKTKSIELIGRLSEFMRFALYECSEEFIDLDNDIRLLTDYIELERVRCDDRVRIDFKIAGEFHGYRVPPMLLMPFVENAFKHGADTQLNQSWINIVITQMEGLLYLRVENDFIESSDHMEARSGGIGIINVKKRLQFYFAGKHELEILVAGNIFSVILTLQLGPVSEQAKLFGTPF